MKAKILVACHKECSLPKEDYYLPIHAGSAVSQVKLNMQRDDEGDNISAKNGSYCELTALYWAWKNLKGIDIVGLCHYRRFFDFHKGTRHPVVTFPVADFDNVDKRIPQKIFERVEKGEIILADASRCNFTMGVMFRLYHNPRDYEKLSKVIKETQPKAIQEAFEFVMECNSWLHFYNMFIMRKRDFDEMCEWLFDVLGKFEAETDVSNYDSYQRRLYGFAAERLMNVWIIAKRHKFSSVPIMYFVDAPAKTIGLFEYKLRGIMHRLAMFLLSPNYYLRLSPGLAGAFYRKFLCR